MIKYRRRSGTFTVRNAMRS